MSKWRISALLAVATAVLMGSSVSVVTAAEPKVGSTCTKVGAFYDTPNKRYVCNAEGKKKVWRVWTAASQSAPASKPSTTPKKTNFKAPIPISLPVKQDGAITFINALEKYADIPQVAWQKVQELITQNPTPAPISNVVHVGPNTELDITGGLPRIQEVLKRNQKLWSGFTQVSRFHLLMYNAQDEPWAEQDWQKTGKEMKYFPGVIAAEVKRIAGNCQQSISPGVFSGPPVNCGGADSTALENSNDAILTFSQGGQGAVNKNPFVTEGGILGHEYTHAVQAAQWIGKPSSYCTEQTATQECNRSWNSNWGFSPCWMFEGLPNSVGPMAVAETYAAYQETRKNLPYGQGPTTVTDYSQSSLRDYLFNQKSSTCYADGGLYRLGYTVGALATEALVAIAGPQSVMAMYALGAEGQDFPTAFKNVYGISWSDASTILSKVLAAQYATFGAPPK